MRYLGQKSLSRILLVALTVAYHVLRVAIIIVCLAIVASLFGLRLPAATGLQVQTPSLVITFPVPPESAAVQTWFRLMLGTVALPAIVTLFYVVRLLRQIFRTLVEDHPFLAENASRVQRIGVALLVLTLVQWVGGILAGSYIAGNVQLPGVTMMVRLNPDLTMACFGILVLILAEVFRRGAQLQEDQDLTV